MAKDKLEHPKYERHTNPTTIKVDSNIKQTVKSFCDKNNIKLKGFADTSLLERLEKMKKIYENN